MSCSSTVPPFSVVYDAPLSPAQNLEYTRRLDPGYAKARNFQLVEDSRAFTIGPIPVRSFLKDFLRVRRARGTGSTLPSKNAFRSVPARAATPEDIYNPLLKILNKASSRGSRCPGFVFANASERSLFPRKLGHMKPHICCYTADNAVVIQNSEPSSRVELGYAEFFIEVKPDPSDDFFVDPPNPASTQEVIDHDFVARSSDSDWNKQRDRALGQHIAYATEIMARQYRHCLFSISLSGSRARFINWDRAGCIVSESFDIREEPELLCDFLWRFSQSSDFRRGHDLTVVKASHEEEAVFREAITKHVKAQLELEGGEELEKEIWEHYEEGHASAIYVADHNNATVADTCRFIVSRPVVSPSRLTGRATRGFWAVDPSTARVVFLKDTWRAAWSFEETEGEALKGMNEVNVKNIPTVIHHGDVPNYIPHGDHKCTRDETQCTMTDEYCSDEWVCKVGKERPNTRKHWHYRIVLGTAGYPLERFRGTKELLHATYDVFHAMRDAYTKDSRLHRDISVGNIIMVREPGESVRRGCLIDWDLSCRIDSLEVGRAGTWLFMSIESLSAYSNERMHTLQDDMESLFYVVLYCSLLWLPHDLSRDALKNTIKYVFELSVWLPWFKFPLGGDGKVMNALYRKFTRSVDFPGNIRIWLDAVMDLYSPLTSHTTTEPSERWSNPDNLDTFWGEFLRTHTLEDADRVIHDHPHATGKYDRIETRSTGDPPESTEAIVFVKRASWECDSVQPVRKRKRVAEALPDEEPLNNPRRSERLQAKRARVEPIPFDPKRNTRRTSAGPASRLRRTSRNNRRTAGRT